MFNVREVVISVTAVLIVGCASGTPPDMPYPYYKVKSKAQKFVEEMKQHCLANNKGETRCVIEEKLTIDRCKSHASHSIFHGRGFSILTREFNEQWHGLSEFHVEPVWFGESRISNYQLLFGDGRAVVDIKRRYSWKTKGASWGENDCGLTIDMTVKIESFNSLDRYLATISSNTFRDSTTIEPHAKLVDRYYRDVSSMTYEQWLTNRSHEFERRAQSKQSKAHKVNRNREEIQNRRAAQREANSKKLNQELITHILTPSSTNSLSVAASPNYSMPMSTPLPSANTPVAAESVPTVSKETRYDKGGNNDKSKSKSVDTLPPSAVPNKAEKVVYEYKVTYKPDTEESTKRALAVTWKTDSGNWKADGHLQKLVTSYNDEKAALKLVCRNETGYRQIGTHKNYKIYECLGSIFMPSDRNVAKIYGLPAKYQNW